MDTEKVIIEQGIARTMFVTAWADEMEEQGRSFPCGAEIMGLAPEETPEVAIKEAYRFVGALENSSRMTLLPLIYQAAKADGQEFPEMPEDSRKDYAITFGHCLFMEALGHGVSWFDSHAKFNIAIPNYENPLLGDPSTLEPGERFAG